MNRGERRRAAREDVRLFAAQGCMADAIRSGYASGVQIAVTWAGFSQLADELGGVEEATAWLGNLVHHGPRPLAVNVPRPDGSSTTFMLGPEGWTPERLQGWLATMAPHLEELFGAFEVNGGERDR